MFYDLNIPWSAKDTELPRTLAFAAELGYNIVALNYTLSGGKLPNELTSPIPNPLPFAQDLPKNFEVRRRVTFVLTEIPQNARLAQLAKEYDILALRPTDEKTFQHACQSEHADIISLDLTQRLPFHFKFPTLSEAVKSGKKLEVCYSQGVLGDAQARRNLISNTTQLIRASRGGRGLIISSEAKKAVGLRGPWDVINLAAVWGLGQERGYEAMTSEARNAVVTAQLKRTSYRGVIDVIYGGEKHERLEKAMEEKGANGTKRKAETTNESGAERPLSKTQMKKRARLALSKAEKKDADVRDVK